MLLVSPGIAPRRVTDGSARLQYLPGAVLLVFSLLTLGVFDPQLYPLNFDQLTLQATVRELSTPNLGNQLRWLALAGVATTLVIRAPSRLLSISIRLRYLLILLALCALSAIWSEYPETTLRRAFALMVSAYCLLVAVAYIDRADRAVVIVYLTFWTVLVLNVGALGRSEAFDELGFYRGVIGNKNTLGSIACLAIFFGLSVGTWLKSLWLRLANLAYLAAWAGILILSVSKTSIGLVIIVPVAFFALKGASGALRLNLGVAAIGLVALVVVILSLGHYGAGYSLADFGRLADVTFTERTPIWAFMLRQIGNNWPIGTGFGSFWGVGFDAPNLKSIYPHVRLINQAHNGYLDVLATLGVVGLGLILVVIVQFSRAADRLRVGQGALFALLWFLVLFSLLHNMLESSLLVPFNVVWHMTLFAFFLCQRAGGDVWER